MNSSFCLENGHVHVQGAQIQVQQAQLSVQQAQDALEEEAATIGDQIAVAQRAVTQAELNLQQARLNLLSVMDTSQAELNLRQAELNFEAARRRSADTAIIAPFAGTILAVSASVGQTAGTTPLITLANLDQAMIELYLDESDIASVAVGNPISVVFDALPEQTFTGEVMYVDPQLIVANNGTTVRTLASIETDLIGTQPVVGMNGTVDVIGGQAQNALLVPIEAVRELSPGQFAVFVMENGEPKLTFVEVGLRDFTFAEITSGLQVGDIVTTGIVETQ